MLYSFKVFIAPLYFTSMQFSYIKYTGLTTAIDSMRNHFQLLINDYNPTYRMYMISRAFNSKHTQNTYKQFIVFVLCTCVKMV